MSSGSVNAFATSTTIAGVADCAATQTDAATNAASSGRMNRFIAMSLPRRGARLRRSQDELLHAPRFDLTQNDFVGIATVHHVNHLEAGRLLAWFSEFANHGAIELGLVDLACRLP